MSAEQLILQCIDNVAQLIGIHYEITIYQPFGIKAGSGESKFFSYVRSLKN